MTMMVWTTRGNVGKRTPGSKFAGEFAGCDGLADVWVIKESLRDGEGEGEGRNQECMLASGVDFAHIQFWLFVIVS